ncbi:uncharacterized protein LOC117522385 [Thalassophryne amazonica]|uniref:uncharacterized protein LOC117522385 n=1 Tax=Thalassophryne amazonica TaxID=390379 RepID=UPI001472228E|nr:uncharacterized protein LOC117522385 [Thalassophryne amazonica]
MNAKSPGDNTVNNGGEELSGCLQRSKPSSQPPECKPKLPITAATSRQTPPSAHTEEEHKESLKVLQVAKELPNENILAGGEKQPPPREDVFPTSQITKWNSPELQKSDPQTAQQQQTKGGVKEGNNTKKDGTRSYPKEEARNDVLKEMPTQNSAPVEKGALPPFANVHMAVCVHPAQKNQEVPLQTQRQTTKMDLLADLSLEKADNPKRALLSPAQSNKEDIGPAVNKVKLTKTVTLQKEVMIAGESKQELST